MESMPTAALPEGYAEQMKRLLGEAGFFAYLHALSMPTERALRVNLLLRPDGVPHCKIDGCGAPVPWARGAYFVDSNAHPGTSPLHEAGLYYLQEPSALSAVTALDPQPGERILDLCAAPGGKSTQIAALMGGQGMLVCNDIVPSRAQILSRNVERMGVRNAIVTCASPQALSMRFPAYFDRVLVDAPCSGEGMFRRQIDARAEWTPASVQGCAARQLEILDHAAVMLRPGGTLVYSTCTFNDIENEGVLDSFLHNHPAFSLVPFALPGLPEAKNGYVHLYPHEIRGEGHFVSLLHRSNFAHLNDDIIYSDVLPAARSPKHMGEKTSAEDAILAGLDVLAPQIRFTRMHLLNGALWALPEGAKTLQLDGMRVLRMGLLLARKQGKRWEPDHALAMALSPEEAKRIMNLTREQTLAYQAGETLHLQENAPAGYTLLCCEGISVGWGKQANGVMKNHYPKGLRRR